MWLFRGWVLCGSLAMALSVYATSAVGQGPTSSIVGRVTDEHGIPVRYAMVGMVEVIESRHQTLGDTTGRFALRNIEPGSAVIRVSALGYESRDTTVELVAGKSIRWNVVLTEAEWKRKEAEARAAAAAAGSVDSFTVGGLVTDSSSAFTYGSFGTALLHAATSIEGPDSNIVLSPFGGGQALALALLAARDSTEMAMARTLGIGPLTSRSLASRNRSMNAGLQARRDLVLKVANAIWVDTSETLKPEFEGLAKSEFGAVARTIPLTAPEVVRLLNRWADSTTAGRIREVQGKPFEKGISVVLTNAVYLKSTWLTPFDSTRTKPRPFTLASGRRVSLPMMESRSDLGYRRGDGYQAVRLPYKAGLTALYLVLPDSGRRALDMLGGVRSRGWPLPSGRTESRSVHLVLPKIHVEQATDLIPPLERLGMAIAFDSLRADFAGLVVSRPDRPPTCPPLSQVGSRVGLVCSLHRIAKARQHVFFDLDEEGTEAAAVTVVEMGVVESTSAPPPPIEFVVDRPFLFALRDEPSGAFLFVGYVADPTSGKALAASDH
jgi:serine protease inhibitor